jgi:hypothetical protein
MVRSVFLRGFDQQCAEQVADFMEKECKVKFIRGANPTRFEKTADGKVLAFWSSGAAGAAESSDVFDTVLLDIGRTAITDGTNCEAIGVQLDPESRKIVCPADKPTPGLTESTSVPNIFAIGDVVKGGLELTPVAILAGKLLAGRLYDGSDKIMNYNAVATTVFTPIEYGFVGLSEEDATKQYPDGIEVYHSYFDPLELTVAHRALGRCYVTSTRFSACILLVFTLARSFRATRLPSKKASIRTISTCWWASILPVPKHSPRFLSPNQAVLIPKHRAAEDKPLAGAVFTRDLAFVFIASPTQMLTKIQPCSCLLPRFSSLHLEICGAMPPCCTFCSDMIDPFTSPRPEAS